MKWYEQLSDLLKKGMMTGDKPNKYGIGAAALLGGGALLLTTTIGPIAAGLLAIVLAGGGLALGAKLAEGPTDSPYKESTNLIVSSSAAGKAVSTVKVLDKDLPNPTEIQSIINASQDQHRRLTKEGIALPTQDGTTTSAITLLASFDHSYITATTTQRKDFAKQAIETNESHLANLMSATTQTEEFLAHDKQELSKLKEQLFALKTDGGLTMSKVIMDQATHEQGRTFSTAELKELSLDKLHILARNGLVNRQQEYYDQKSNNVAGVDTWLGKDDSGDVKQAIGEALTAYEKGQSTVLHQMVEAGSKSWTHSNTSFRQLEQGAYANTPIGKRLKQLIDLDQYAQLDQIYRKHADVAVDKMRDMLSSNLREIKTQELELRKQAEAPSEDRAALDKKSKEAADKATADLKNKTTAEGQARANDDGTKISTDEAVEPPLAMTTDNEATVASSPDDAQMKRAVAQAQAKDSPSKSANLSETDWAKNTLLGNLVVYWGTPKAKDEKDPNSPKR